MYLSVGKVLALNCPVRQMVTLHRLNLKMKGSYRFKLKSFTINSTLLQMDSLN
ncbi:hypothetical protein D3C81_2008870 [compost metagenome]